MPSNVDLERAYYLSVLDMTEQEAANLSVSDLRASFIAGGAGAKFYGFNAEDHNYKGWTFDPALSNGGQVVSAGALHLIKIKLSKSGTISTITMFQTNQGGTLTAGQCFAGLYAEDGTLLAQTADLAAIWMGSAAIRATPLQTPVEVEAGVYFIGLVANGTTPPGFTRGATSGVGNAGLTAPNLRSSIAATAQTSLPNPAPVANQSAFSAHYWAALS